MIDVNVCDLKGAALDWAVAKAIKWIEPLFGIGAIRYIESDSYLMMEAPDPDEPEDITKPSHFNHYVQWSPSRIWSQGGLLIDKYRIDMSSPPSDASQAGWDARVDDGRSGWMRGPTPLIAACRAIVAAKLGDTVQVPPELMEQ